MTVLAYLINAGISESRARDHLTAGRVHTYRDDTWVQVTDPEEVKDGSVVVMEPR